MISLLQTTKHGDISVILCNRSQPHYAHPYRPSWLGSVVPEMLLIWWRCLLVWWWSARCSSGGMWWSTRCSGRSWWRPCNRYRLGLGHTRWRCRCPATETRGDPRSKGSGSGSRRCRRFCRYLLLMSYRMTRQMSGSPGSRRLGRGKVKSEGS